MARRISTARITRRGFFRSIPGMEQRVLAPQLFQELLQRDTFQLPASLGIAGRQGIEAGEQGPEPEAGSAAEDGKPSGTADRTDGFPGVEDKPVGVEGL